MALSLSSPCGPISATATIAFTVPCVRKVTPCGTSRNARSSFNACSLSALCDGGRDRDLQSTHRPWQGYRIICQSMRILSRCFKLCTSEIEYRATLYPVATSSFPFPQSNASILISIQILAEGVYLPINALQLSSHLRPGNRARS